MKALVTGGAGFAASHLVEYLLSQDNEVTVLVRPGDEDLSNLAAVTSQVQMERADVRDQECLLQIFRDTKPQRIYHLAALSSPSESLRDPLLTYEVNFGGTLNVFSAVRRLGMDCRILFVSSAEVYGPVGTEVLPLREDAPMRPASPYAGSKAAAELMAMQFFQNYGIAIVRARPFNHTGPRQSPSFVCSSFARQIAEIEAGVREPVVHVGNVKVKRDFSDVRDIVSGYHALLEKGQAGEVYQLGSGGAVPIEEILHILIAASARKIEVKIDESRMRGQESPAIWGDISKAASAVGWKPEIPLKTTLSDLRDYWSGTLRTAPGTPPTDSPPRT